MSSRWTTFLVGSAIVALAGCAPVELPTASPPGLPDVIPSPPAATETPGVHDPASEPSPVPMFTVEPLNPPQTLEVIAMTPVPTIPVPSGVEALVQRAKEDLAARLGVVVDEIGLSEFESVVWPDGGLGCPEPGMAYIQVQVEGYRILLSVGAKTFNYHGSAKRGPFLCDQPASP